MITEVHIENFRSLENVNVTLERLTVLVGKNGAGKSNFIDALRFVQEALQNGVDTAIAHRNGMASLRRWTARGRTNEIEISLRVKRGTLSGEYLFVLAGGQGEEVRVKREVCRARRYGTMTVNDEYEIQEGKWIKRPQGFGEEGANEGEPRLRRMSIQLNTTSLFLPSTRALMRSPLLELFQILTGNNFFAIYPNTLREPQRFSTERLMGDHGEHFASALKYIKNRYETKREGPFADLRAALKAIVGDVNDLRVNQVGNYLLPELQHEAGPWFDLSQESDGTLRMLGLLVGLYQNAPRRGLIAIEEPEINIHPGALGVLADVLREATTQRQVLLTTQSPDLISRFSATELLVADRASGNTQIEPIAESQRQVIEQQLFTAGDLLRIEGLYSEEAETAHA